MRLITHNMLKCNIRGITNGYPLRIIPEKVEDIPTQYDEGIHRLNEKLILLSLV